MSDESPRDGESEPRRLFFDDLPDEPDTAAESGRPQPVATTPAASARRRREIEESLVDTGPMEPIREPIPDEQVTGRQLYFDDIDEPAAEPEEEESRKAAVPALLAGANALGGRRGRHLPIGAVLAVLGVLVLVAVIASIGGRGDGSAKPDNHKVLADQTSKVTSTPKHSAANPPPSRPHDTPSHKPSTSTSPAKPSKSAGTPVAVLKKQPLTVLNNTTISGLAEQAATTFSSRGWNVGGVGNYTGLISSTTVYYDATSPTEQQAATALAGQFAGVMHAEPRFAGLPGTGLTVVLAPNWSA
ncbi:MAG TPA: LytR C-terminal domain-containing protein [Mycobacteriales bacterium]|nr:LytR C-terminal domain-containing protein [Mycobacteriales bacterium]